MECALENEVEAANNLGERLLPPTQDPATATDDDSTDPPELPLPLRFLYGMNGLTLSLPMTSILYIVNTRALVPVAYLSAYSAVAFLPCSLKPFYACLSQLARRRDVLVAVLLVTSGIFTAVTALVPRGGVLLCFLLAFCRGVTSNWPEFLLEMYLIQHAHEYRANYALAASHFQSQAATCRNCGSFFAAVIALLVFLTSRQLNDNVVTILLVASGTLNVLAAAIAWWFRVGYSLYECNCLQQDLDGDARTASISTQQRSSLCQSLFSGNGLVVILFQLCIVVFAMQGPIKSLSSSLTWYLLLLGFFSTLVCLVWNTRAIKWQRLHRVGLFLIARHALPDSSYIIGSFIYSLLQSTPFLLQGLSIINMGATTLSSWSYGRLLAPYNRGLSLLVVMAGTTIASSIFSLGNLLIVKEGTNDNRHWTFYLLVVVVSIVTSFVNEWAFLPDVVLATTTIDNTEQHADTVQYDVNLDCGTSCIVELNGEPTARLLGDGDEHQRACPLVCGSQGIQYASLISCIDFGDQIGAWVTVPLVSALGISRDNDWAGLNEMILITALFGVLSLVLLGFLE